MWLVSNEALLRVSPTTVKVWELKGVEKLTLHMNKGGASLSGSYSGGERLDVRFGMPLLGGLSWADATAIVSAIKTARSSTRRLTLFAPVPEDVDLDCSEQRNIPVSRGIMGRAGRNAKSAWQALAR